VRQKGGWPNRTLPWAGIAWRSRLAVAEFSSQVSRGLADQLVDRLLEGPIDHLRKHGALILLEKNGFVWQKSTSERRIMKEYVGEYSTVSGTKLGKGKCISVSEVT
jgi:hypothetical protein